MNIAIPDDDEARATLERLRWPNGPVCPHCASVEAYRIEKRKRTAKTRKGLYACKACRRQFTVTVGTIFEDSHISLGKWLAAFHLVTASKKGIKAHQFHGMLKVTYESARSMARRIHVAVRQPLMGVRSGETN